MPPITEKKDDELKKLRLPKKHINSIRRSHPTNADKIFDAITGILNQKNAHITPYLEDGSLTAAHLGEIASVAKYGLGHLTAFIKTFEEEKFKPYLAIRMPDYRRRCQYFFCNSRPFESENFYRFSCNKSS